MKRKLVPNKYNQELINELKEGLFRLLNEKREEDLANGRVWLGVPSRLGDIFEISARYTWNGPCEDCTTVYQAEVYLRHIDGVHTFKYPSVYKFEATTVTSRGYHLVVDRLLK